MGAADQTSQDTALRDIDDLLSKGVLIKDAAGGRSTSLFANRCGNNNGTLAARRGGGYDGSSPRSS
jgi:hypothetical protein